MILNCHALRVIRERSGFSQTQVAELAEIDRPNYAHIEAGRRKGTPEQIVAIARVLDVPTPAITHTERDAA
jgi:transcriptional regulator with XRE-family HTH domain